VDDLIAEVGDARDRHQRLVLRIGLRQLEMLRRAVAQLGIAGAFAACAWSARRTPDTLWRDVFVLAAADKRDDRADVPVGSPSGR